MALFNFNRLIVKYGRNFVLLTTTSGQYQSGKWMDGGEIETHKFGAILCVSERKIYQLGGSLTTKDKHLYLAEPISFTNGKVKYGGDLYKIEEYRSSGNDEFTGVYAYTLKWVSKFD